MGSKDQPKTEEKANSMEVFQVFLPLVVWESATLGFISLSKQIIDNHYTILHKKAFCELLVIGPWRICAVSAPYMFGYYIPTTTGLCEHGVSTIRNHFLDTACIVAALLLHSMVCIAGNTKDNTFTSITALVLILFMILMLLQILPSTSTSA